MAIQEALEEENTKNTPSFGTEELEVIHRSSTEAGLLGIHNFAQKAIGAFRFSAALIEWLQSELECKNGQVVRLSPVRQIDSTRTENYLAR